MARCGLPVAEGYVVTSDFEFGGGFSAMQQLLALPQRPQAVFVGNDAMAVGAYQAFTRPGCRFRRIWRWWATMILNWHAI
jgi:LacI family transcriptional regulator